jgi:NIMA (never in mitosis gene a)-related kinase
VLEATILSRINSPYIVKFYDSFTDKNQINIVMEYCENGDLGQYLKRQTGKLLTESKIWKFFVEMCLGL